MSFSNPYSPSEPNFKNLAKTPATIKHIMESEDKPMGRVYLRDTGSTCIDVSGVAVERVKRYSIMDFNQGKTLLESALMDVSGGATPTIDDTRCAKVTIKEQDIGEKNKRENTKYVSLSEIIEARPSIFKNNKKPVFVAEGKEGFEGFKSFNEMDMGQQIFLSSATVLALYVYYKLVRD
jgi:hypothetical protein